VTTLTSEAIDYVIEKVLSLIKQALTTEPPNYLGEIQKLKKELANFMALIASGQTSTGILAETPKREIRIQSLEEDMKRLSETPAAWDPRQLRQQLHNGIGRFKILMQGDVAAAQRRSGNCSKNRFGVFRWNGTARKSCLRKEKRPLGLCCPKAI
jgi:hypothetical protein